MRFELKPRTNPETTDTATSATRRTTEIERDSLEDHLYSSLDLTFVTPISTRRSAEGETNPTEENVYASIDYACVGIGTASTTRRTAEDRQRKMYTLP